MIVKRLIGVTVWVLILSLLCVGVAYAQEGEAGSTAATTEASIAVLLAPLLAAATAIERAIEGIFNLIESAVLSLSSFSAIGGEYVAWAKEQVKRYRSQLLKMKGDPVQIRAAEKLLHDAEQRLKDWLKSEPYVSLKRSASLALGIVFGLLVAFTTKLKMFQLLNVTMVPANMDIIVTGLVIGTGSAPVHSLIGILQKTRDAIDEARALARGRSIEAIKDVLYPTPLAVAPAVVPAVAPAAPPEERGPLPSIAGVAPGESTEVRRRTVEALGTLEDHRAVEPLVGALVDEDEVVRAEAKKALKRTRDKLEAAERARDVEAMRLTRQILHP
jgi:ElaB/YqjD/DUF883 family membrane-anchored ribosome-binding protein